MDCFNSGFTHPVITAVVRSVQDSFIADASGTRITGTFLQPLCFECLLEKPNLAFFRDNPTRLLRADSDEVHALTERDFEESERRLCIGAPEYDPEPAPDAHLDDWDDSMDGDHESALASAGWGTDEDYGFFGDDGGWGE